MPSFRVVALPTETAEFVRTTGKSPVYGFPAHKEVATGRAPCRHCLRLIRPLEEELLLFTYDPFRALGVPPLPGPVYLHAKECTRYKQDSIFPEEYLGRLLTFAAYGADRKLLEEKRLTNGGEEATAEQLWANPEVEYIHLRSTEAGCYLFRMDRA
jgi:hypothetical protein